MASIKPKSWSVSLFAQQIEEASIGSENFNTVIVHPEIIEREFDHCCKQVREIDHASESHTYKIVCKKGLWIVDGTDLEFVRREAMRYFIQYWSDGEYDDILDAMEDGK